MSNQRLALSFCLLAAIPTWLSAGEVFTPRGTQPPLTFPLLDPDTCGSCHADYDSQNHLEPWDTWAGSMMANASRDPIFWAALDVANNDVPGIGEFCLRCHSSAGWLEGRADADIVPDPPETGAADGCQLVGKIDEPGDDFTGLSCHLCHRMMVNDNAAPGEDPVYFENGDFWLDDGNCPDGGSGPCRRGPYDYPPNPAAPHEWAYSVYHVDNEICGNCHNVTNPLLNLRDEAGVDLGIGFPIERTFKEWQRSDFSDDESPSFANCSACHMPDANASPAYASSRGNPDRSGDLPLHQFAGGNTWIPQILKGPDFPGLDRDASLDATTAWARDMLQNRSAVVEISADSTVIDGGTLSAEVKITNLSGHKLPTGYGEGRRMWLNVTARDGLDQVFWESGAWSPTTGDLTQDMQAKIYEVQQGIWNYNLTDNCDVEDDATGKHLFHFVRNNCIALDNRIPPLGFTPMNDPEIVPVNYSYPETFPGSGILVNWDTTQYSIPVPPGTPTPVTVETVLYYQTASKEYVEFLRDQAVDNDFPDDCLDRNVPLDPGMSRGEYLYSLWDNPLYGRSPPVDMGSATAEVPIVVEDMFADGFESGDTTAWDFTVP